MYKIQGLGKVGLSGGSGSYSEDTGVDNGYFMSLKGGSNSPVMVEKGR
jgi:hypothetical protein